MTLALPFPAPQTRVVSLPLVRRASFWRLGALSTLTVVAYHHTLNTLFQSLTVDTPLAYLGLVPFIAMAIGFAAWRQPEAGPPIHDRQLDYIVGVPLVLAALAIEYVLPHRMSTMFWVWRIDVLSLPVFIAGAVAVLFGVRPLWRLRGAVLFLLLAWPYPYTLAMFSWLDGFTNLTIRALESVTKVIPVATHSTQGDGSIFDIGHGAGKVSLSVASACSGANGLLGFLLIAGALTMGVVKGPRLGKSAWLVVGSMLIWGLNVARILIIFWIAHQWGESVAVNGFHPFIGVVMFGIGVGIMLAVLRLFRLRVDPGLFGPRLATDQGGRSGGRYLAGTVMLAVALPLAVLNAGLVRFDLVANSFGIPRLIDFTNHPARLDGWSVPRKIGQYDWTKRFFGDSSTWYRFQLVPTGKARTDGKLWSSVPVIVDVVSTSDQTRFSAYGLEACYRFHRYNISDTNNVDLGGGVVGTVLAWRDGKSPILWNTVYWYWPVRDGNRTRYERMVVLLPDQGQTLVQVPNQVVLDPSGTRSSPVAGATAKVGDSKLSSHDRDVRTFLVAIARDVIAHQGKAPTTNA